MSNKSQHKIIFLADSGRQIGWGHYTRSKALADELTSRGAEVRFYLRGEIPTPPLGEHPVSILEGEITAFLQNVSPHVNTIVLDLYAFSSEILKSLEAWPVSVCIDDGNELEFHCHLLVNPNVNEEFIHRTGPSTKYLHGGKSIVLRPQFDNVPKRKCRKEAAHLIVALGGTDPANLTLWTIRLLKHKKDLGIQKITVLVGDPSIKERLTSMTSGDERFQILHGVEDVVSLLYEADVGVIAAGTLLYEAAVTGLPSLVVSLNEPQAREARAFANRRAIRYQGNYKAIRDRNWVEELRALIPWGVRQEMAKNSQLFIDGKGRGLVANAIMEFIRMQGTKAGSGMPPAFRR